MSKQVRYTIEQVTAWLAESERICTDAENLVLVENGSRGSRKLLALAQYLRACAVERASEVAAARGIARAS